MSKYAKLFILFFLLIPIPLFAFEQTLIIEAQQTAKTVKITLPSSVHGATLQVDTTIGATEEIPIEQLNSDGRWGTISYGGVEQVLSANTTQVKINSINIIRVNKPATAADVGVTMIKN